MKNKNEKAIQWLEEFSNEIELDRQARELLADTEVKRISLIVKHDAAQALDQWKQEASAHNVKSPCAKAGLSERVGEAVEQIVVGIKQLLSEYKSESFVAAHLGDDVAPAEPDVVRMIPLADYPGLRQRLPWLGGALRVYQQERRPDQNTAKFTAFAETLDVEPNDQGGELRVVLSASDGKRSEVLLSFDFPSSDFPLRLSADESQLTLECYANSAA